MNIINIIKQEKKDKLTEIFKDDKFNVDMLIQNENYFISNIDILTLTFINKIPLVIVSTLIQPENKNNVIIVNKSQDNSYYFIKIIETESLLNKYRLFINDGNILFNESNILDSFLKTINSENEFNLINYINNFKLKNKKPKFKLVEN